MAAAIVTKHQEAFGFGRDEVEAEEWQPYETVAVPRATLLSEVARAAEVPERVLLDLNPELRRTCTPPRSYPLKVPRGQAETFARNWEQVASEAGKLAFAHHRVQRGESMAAIAQSYGVPAATVQRMNGIRAGRALRPGAELVVPLSAAARREVAVAVAAEPPERAVGRPRRATPAPAASPVPRASPALVEVQGRTRSTVQVQPGDSLWAIAQRWGVAVAELARWNGIQNPRRHRLLPGDQLVVYSSGSPLRPPGSG
jgi:membrane-bound lytic murein transglycosylase D